MLDDPKGSRSIRVLDVIEAVCNLDRPASIADIVAGSDLPKATVHRLCNLLIEEGFLRRDIENKGFEIGPRFARVAMKALGNAGARAERHAILEALVRDIGETCNLAMPDATTMIYLDRVESEWPLRIQLPVGSRVPLHCTASGKLFLASLGVVKRRKLLQKLTLDARSDNTITDPEKLEKRLQAIADAGVSTDDEEFIPGMVAVAVPVKDASGRLIATLASHGPVVRMSLERAMTWVPKLKKAAADIAATLS